MILVTGALGRVGHATTRSLHRRGVAVKALVPSRAHVPGLAELGIPLAEGDYDDARGLSAALDGVDTVVLLPRPSADLVAVQEHVIDRCATVGVRRIVKLSAAGASATARSDAARWHWRIEEHLRRAPLASCVVRPMRQMQELLHELPLLLTNGMLVGCQGEGRVSEIDARDVGAVLAACAVADALPTEPVVATGPVALDRWTMCELLSSAFGRPVRYVNCSAAELESTLLASGLSPWQVHDLVTMETSAAEGAFDLVSDAVETMTGRPPRRFEQYANELATALSYTNAPERALVGTHGGVQ